ncbi:MAG: hypothetical protein IKT88_08340, partial [Lachnospiraceae bacterium]|nr:hypothetical protein [Lachnospiraceae bacterium]
AVYADIPTITKIWQSSFGDEKEYVDFFITNRFDKVKTLIFEKDGKHYLMLDHWIPHNLQESGYSILPITFDNGRLTVRWCDSPEELFK